MYGVPASTIPTPAGVTLATGSISFRSWDYSSSYSMFRVASIAPTALLVKAASTSSAALEFLIFAREVPAHETVASRGLTMWIVDFGMAEENYTNNVCFNLGYL